MGSNGEMSYCVHVEGYGKPDERQSIRWWLVVVMMMVVVVMVISCLCA